MKLEERIEELERRVRDLEARPVYASYEVPYPPPMPPQPHYVPPPYPLFLLTWTPVWSGPMPQALLS